MSSEDLEKYETEMELQLYREYRDVVGLFPLRHRNRAAVLPRQPLTLDVRIRPTARCTSRSTLHDAWVWDMYRPARFVKNVRVVTFKDVNVEELAKSDLQLPDDKDQGFS